MATHANTAQSMEIKCMKGGGPAHQCSHTFQVLGVGHIQENPRSSRSPTPFIHFIPMLWAVLACVAILPTTGNYWNHLELLGFSWMCPTGVQVPPPLSYILFPCSGVCWHALPFSILVDTIGTTWNSWMCPTPSTWNVWLHWCAGPPPFIHFIPMLWAVLACVAILPTTGNYWNHLELLGFSWMCPTPSTWNVWLHCCAAPPPFIHFIPMVWAVLACVAILPTIGNYWNHLELLGFSWMCPTPSTWNVWLHWCAGPPPFIHFISMLWAVLACVAILPTTGNYWNHLELLGFSWMCPTPSTWNVWLHWCAGPPPFHTFYSHALGCVGMRCHSPYYWKLLEPPGTYTTLGFSWMCPAPQYLKCMAALMCRSPPFKHDKQKTRSWCWGVDSWGRRILRTMGWWRKVSLCSTLWVRLLKASDTIRLWNSMFD